MNDFGGCAVNQNVVTPVRTEDGVSGVRWHRLNWVTSGSVMMVRGLRWSGG